jgi:hypothetical protein
VKAALLGLFAEIAAQLDRPQLDRPLALVIAAHRLGHQRPDFFLHLGFARQRFRFRHVRHLGLVREALLEQMERHRHGKDGVAVLDRHHAPRGKAAAVADAVDLVDDRHLGIAAEQKIRVQRMRRARRDVLDGAAGGDQRLADHLAAEHALPAVLRRAAAEQIELERLQVENFQQSFDGGRHCLSREQRPRRAGQSQMERAKIKPL